MDPFFARSVKPLIVCAAVIACLGSVCAAPPEYVLTVKPARKIEAVQTFDVTYPEVKATEWLVFASAAPESPSQTKVSTKFSLEGKADTELSDLKRPIVWAKVPVTGDRERTHLRYTVTYKATLLERRLERLPKGQRPPKIAPLPDDEKKWYVAATETFYDYETKVFQEWLDEGGLRIKRSESDVDFARRVFLHIADTSSTEFRQSNDRHASAVCQSLKSDCGGLSVLFIAAMRANGIPARALVGNWTYSSQPDQKAGDIPYTQQHVRAEFFAVGIGWVPVDQSSAVHHYKGKRELMLRQSFGYDAANYFVRQVDFDIILDNGVYGKQTVPWIWCTALPMGEGKRAGFRGKDEWTVRTIR